MEQWAYLATTPESIESSFVLSIHETFVNGWSLVARLRDLLDVFEWKEPLNYTQCVTSNDLRLFFNLKMVRYANQ